MIMLAEEHELYPYVSDVLAYFDTVVEQGTDQQLFIASYLQGHFSLVISQVLASSDSSMLQIDTTMRASLTSAFSQQELSPQDQKQTLNLWDRLYKKNFSLGY
jgi:hypothetical protein